MKFQNMGEGMMSVQDGQSLSWSQREGCAIGDWDLG